MAESKNGEHGQKIAYEKIAEMGSGLVIARVSADSIREQDINARIMKNEMQRQLTDNIKKRGQLESLPFCALTHDGERVEIISGHHRIRFAHNAISGFDDQSMLKELAKLMDDVDDMIESYAGKEILEVPDSEIDKLLSPTLTFDWKNIVFAFLPHQIDDVNALVEAIQKFAPDYVGVADIEAYKPFMEALAKYQEFANVKNVGAAIHAMTKTTLQQIDDSGYNDTEEWVQLTSIFGGSAIPKEKAERIKEAVEKMVEDGLVQKKRRWQALEVLADCYMAGE